MVRGGGIAELLALPQGGAKTCLLEKGVRPGWTGNFRIDCNLFAHVTEMDKVQWSNEELLAFFKIWPGEFNMGKENATEANVRC